MGYEGLKNDRKFLSAQKVQRQYDVYKKELKIYKDIITDITISTHTIVSSGRLLINLGDLSVYRNDNRHLKFHSINYLHCDDISTINRFLYSKKEQLQEKIYILQKEYNDTSNTHLLFKIHVLLKELRSEINKKVNETKKLLSVAIFQLKTYLFIRDVRKTITSVILKHYKMPSDESGSDINVFNAQFLNIINNYKKYYNARREQISFYKYTGFHYQQRG